MQKTATINTRIDPKTKKAAEAVFAELGLSTTDAITLFLKQVHIHRGLPFDVRIPNKETRKAIKDAQLGRNMTRHENVQDMWESLRK